MNAWAINLPAFRVAARVTAIVIALLLGSLPARASSRVASIWVVEPGVRAPQLFGHVFLCFDDDGPNSFEADCYNFAALASPASSFLSDLVEGRAMYSTEVWPAVRVTARYRAERRRIIRVPVRATPHNVDLLRQFVDEHFVRGQTQPYVYRLFAENCTTRIVVALRHVLGPSWQGSVGLQTGGRSSVRQELDTDFERGPLLRAALVLATDSLLGGIDVEKNDKRAWFLPTEFASVEEPRFHFRATLWRLALIGILAVLCSLRRCGRLALALLLGGMAIAVWAARWCGGMPELTANQAWLLFCPLDVCLAWQGTRVRQYRLCRFLVVAAIMVASLVGKIEQPLLWPGLAILAGLAPRFDLGMRSPVHVANRHAFSEVDSQS